MERVVLSSFEVGGSSREEQSADVDKLRIATGLRSLSTQVAWLLLGYSLLYGSSTDCRVSNLHMSKAVNVQVCLPLCPLASVQLA